MTEGIDKMTESEFVTFLLKTLKEREQAIVKEEDIKDYLDYKEDDIRYGSLKKLLEGTGITISISRHVKTRERLFVFRDEMNIYDILHKLEGLSRNILELKNYEELELKNYEELDLKNYEE